LNRKYKIAVVNSHPIQYFAPLYAYLNRDPQLEVTALYCSDSSLRGALDHGFKQAVQWDIDLLAGYRSIFLGEAYKTRQPAGFFSLVCPEVWGEVRRGGYDALWIHGYAHAVNLIAAAAAVSKGIPVFVRSETHLGLQRTGWKRGLRDFVLRHAYRHLAGFLAIGSGNKAYYKSLGAPEDRIFDVPYTVDNARFGAQAKLDAEARAALLAGLGLDPSHPVIIYASKFMRRKHPDHLIEAFARIRAEGLQANLLMVGAGELDAELRQRVQSLKLDKVAFPGFANQQALPRLFGASDIFVLPSENEPWGLIVNEAMAAGLPVVVSEEIGCTADLVINGRSGIKFPCGDINALTAALRELTADPAKRRHMAQGAKDVIAQWSYEQCRHGVLRSLGTRNVSALQLQN